MNAVNSFGKGLSLCAFGIAAVFCQQNAAAVVVQAESFSSANDTTAGNSGTAACTNTANVNVDIQTTTDAGGGCNVGWIANGEWLQYSINVPAGTYRANVRVASQGGGGSYSVLIDGAQVVGSTAVGNTGGWQTWVTQSSGTFAVSAGTHTLRINVNGAMNLNWIDIVARRHAHRGNCAPAWSSTAVYNAGNTASVNGVNYRANWWTQGNNPATNNGPTGSGQPWTIVRLMHGRATAAAAAPHHHRRRLLAALCSVPTRTSRSA